MLGGKACSTCVYGSQMWGYGKPNIGACLTCTAKKGDTYAGACNACAQSVQPGRCFSCLDTMPLKICGANQTVGTNGCQIGPDDQTPCDKCSNVAKSDAVFKECMACYQNPNWSNECDTCGGMATNAVDQTRCFKCIKTARFPSFEYYGCGYCFLHQVSSKESCLQCVEDKAVPYAAKSTCTSCYDTDRQATSSLLPTKCLSCLRTQQKDYSQACL